MEYMMFLTHFKPCRSGYASYAYNLINSIAEQKPERSLIIVSCIENADRDFRLEKTKNMTIIRFWGSRMFAIDIYKMLRAILKYKPKIIYIYYPLFTTPGNIILNAFANTILLLMLTFFIFLKKFKLIIDIDNLPKVNAPIKIKIMFLTLYFPAFMCSYLNSDIVFACRTLVMKKLLKRYSRKIQIRYIPHGCSLGAISLEKSISVKRALGLDDKKVILQLGYISRYKGIDCLIKAFARIHDKFPEAVLLIAGDYFNPLDKYDFKKHKYLSYLKKLVKELGMENRVIFHTFHIPDEYLEFYFAIADVICFPYITHIVSSSGVFALAMGYGKPVIVSDCGWFDDAIKNRENGLVVPEGDVNALADAIALLLRDDELRLKLGMNLASKANEYSWPNIALLWSKLLDEIEGKCA